MKDFVVIVKYDNGSTAIVGYYRYLKSAINVAKANNECRYLFHYEYSVKQLSTGKILYSK